MTFRVGAAAREALSQIRGKLPPLVEPSGRGVCAHWRELDGSDAAEGRAKWKG